MTVSGHAGAVGLAAADAVGLAAADAASGFAAIIAATRAAAIVRHASALRVARAEPSWVRRTRGARGLLSGVDMVCVLLVGPLEAFAV